MFIHFYDCMFMDSCFLLVWFTSLSSQLELANEPSRTFRANMARYTNELEQAEPKQFELAHYPTLQAVDRGRRGSHISYRGWKWSLKAEMWSSS
jgi:hypothetical protein